LSRTIFPPAEIICLTSISVCGSLWLEDKSMNDILAVALKAMAEASDEIVEGSGDAIREFSKQFASRPKPETSFDDPDHWNIEEGGNPL
jgi:hypothetical protein